MNGIHQTKQGFWVLDNDAYISKWCEELGRLDHDRTIDILCELIPVGGVAIDAGAAIGDHTVFYGHRVGSRGRVLAFEPNPQAFACLVMNTIGQPWVEPFRVALGAQDGRVAMNFRPDNIWASNVIPESSGNVAVCALDNLVEHLNLDRLDFIKMDVEGFEPLLLRGAEKTITAFRPVIATEVNKGAMAAAGFDGDELSRFLSRFGYKQQMIDPAHTTGLPQYDCLFMPPNKG